MNTLATRIRHMRYMAEQACDHQTLHMTGVLRCSRCMKVTWKRVDRAAELSRTMTKSGDLLGATWDELTAIGRALDGEINACN